MLAINGGEKLKKTTPPAWPVVTDTDREMLKSAIMQGDLCGGKLKREFEKRFAEYCNTKYCFAVANGTVSLEIILRAYGIGRGDEVILPPYTFIATFSSIVFTGATPVFADIDEKTFLISPTEVEKRITDKTKAIVAVAVGGCPPDLDALEEIAKRRNVKLIVDAAQGVGAEWKGRSICACGDVASVSCQNTKNLTCGEGGMITTDDPTLAEAISLMLDGGKKDGEYVSVSQDHGISEPQASLLLSQLTKLDGEMYKREKNAAYLSGRLRELEFVSAVDYDDRITRHAYHLYMIRFDKEVLAKKGIDRKLFVKAVNAEGVPLSTGYSPVYSFPCVKGAEVERILGRSVDTTPLPTCERICCEEGAWLGQSVLLETREDMDLIADAFIKVWEHADELKDL